MWGVRTQNLSQKAIPFDIPIREIQKIDKATVPGGGMRAQDALVLHTENQKIVLLSLERTDELLKQIEPNMEE